MEKREGSILLFIVYNTWEIMAHIFQLVSSYCANNLGNIQNYDVVKF